MFGVSGKTWRANKLQAELGQKAGHLWLDDFYRDQSHLTRETLPNQIDRRSGVDWLSFERVLAMILREILQQRPGRP